MFAHLLPLLTALIGAGSSLFPFQAAMKHRPSATDYFSVESFSLPSSLVGQPALIVAMDFDHDGDLDIVIVETLIPPAPAPYGNGRLIALRNDGQGRFSDATSKVFGNARAEVGLTLLVADFNKDGRQDLFVPCWGNDRFPWVGAQNRIFIQSPKGRLIDETSSRLPVILAFTGVATFGDIDNDGDLDVYCPPGGWYPNTPHFLINDGNGYFKHKNDNLPADMIAPDFFGRRSDCALMVDVDKDGDTDLVLGAMPLRTRDKILLNDGKGYFAYAPEDAMPLRLFGQLGCTDQIISADFNKDGWPDLMLHTYKGWSSDPARLELFLNNCNGTFRDATSDMPRSVTSAWSRAAVDFNNDGWMDYFDSDVNTGAGLKLFMNKGNAQFVEMRKQLLPPTPDGGNPSEAFPFDVDGDGDIDIFAVINPYQDSQGNFIPGTAYIFRNLTPYTFSTKVLFPALLQAPAKGETGVGASVVLRWTDQNKKPYPEETQYQVRVKRAGGNYKYFNVKKGRAYLRLTGLMLGTTYCWNIKAVGNGKDIKDSEWAVSGNDWKFTTK